MSLNKYVTNDGDTLDMIAHRVFGDSRYFLEILDANYGLSDMPPVLEAGIIINLPATVTQTSRQTITLWD